MADAHAEPPQERRRLVLKPRDETAARQAEQERLAKVTHNPFGAAKPREAVLAARTGKTEAEILQEAVKSERLRLRLNAAQLEQKQALEALASEAKEAVSAAVSEEERAAAQVMVKQREAAIDELMDKFAAASLEAAQRGEVLRPSERRYEQQQQQLAAGGALHEGGGGGSFGYGGGKHGGFQERYNEPRAAHGQYNDEGRYDQGAGGGYEEGGARGRYHKDGAGYREPNERAGRAASGSFGKGGGGGFSSHHHDVSRPIDIGPPGVGVGGEVEVLPGMPGAVLRGGAGGGGGVGDGPWQRAAAGGGGGGGPVDYVSPYGSSQDRY